MKRFIVSLVALVLLVAGALAARQVSSTQPQAQHPKSNDVSAPLGGGASTTSAQNQSQTSNPSKVPLVKQAEKGDVSPALRTLPARVTRVKQPPEEANENASLPRRSSSSKVIDSVVQGLLGPLAMPTPVLSFDGQFNEYGPIPPDTNGDVGRNHYIQIVNSGFKIFNKAGATLYGPTNNNVLFT